MRDAIRRIVERDASRERIGWLRIGHDGSGWTLTVSYTGLGRVHPNDLGSDRPAGPRHTVSVDMDSVPDGVTVRAWERDPDSVHRLPDPDRPVKTTVQAMIGRLAESGLLGSPLDVERHDPASVDAVAHDPWPTWYVRPNRSNT